MALALRGFDVDDETAVLHRHHLFHLNDAGICIDFDFGHLHAPHAAVGEVGWFTLVGILTAHGKWHGTKLRASFLPAQRSTGIAFYSHRSVYRFQLCRLSIECRRHLSEEPLARVHSSTSRGRTHATDGGRAAGTSGRRIHRVPNLQADRVHRNTEGIGRNHQDAGSRSGSEILRTHLDIHRAIRMNSQIAVAGVAASAPRMQRKTDAAREVAGFVLTTWMPLLLPTHQVRSDTQFFGVDGLPRLAQLDVLQKEVEGIHVELGREIIEGAHRDHGCLRVIGCPPGSSRTDVVANGRVFLALVGNTEDIGNRRHAAAAGTTRPP